MKAVAILANAVGTIASVVMLTYAQSQESTALGTLLLILNVYYLLDNLFD